MSRILVWFSCGAASAVAAKVAVERYGRDVDVCYCDLSRDEHPDNRRFLSDVERWIGRDIICLSHPNYKSIEDVWLGERYVAGVGGAACTRVLKREVREMYQRPDDEHVIGYTADEAGRIADFENFNPELKCRWILAAGGITKSDCYKVLVSAGIELPWMYRNGYDHNNCIGCCKGGMGYWNKIKRDFPGHYEQRRRVFAELGVKPFQRPDGTRFGLDELSPEDGRDVQEPDIECGLFCANYSKLVELTVSKL